ncbi:MAG: DUF4860 domain-containing protein [Coriobacteriales bacterium]|jgi:hypothetical protein|nr:DUF4860 domain-containing protein [Coriobacteriales bacterium]
MFLVLALFCVYAVSALILCVLGANIYKDTTATMHENYDLRTGVLYVAEKTRQNDVAEGVRVDTLNGADALVFTEQRTGKGYETWIFVDKGVLYEEMVASGSAVQITAGQAIMPMRSMALDLVDGNLLTVSFILESGEESHIQLAVKAATTYVGEGSSS